MAENSLDPEPRPNPRDNESDNEGVVDEEGNILNISQNSQSSNMVSHRRYRSSERYSSYEEIISPRAMLKILMSKLNACLTCALKNACSVKQSICFM